MIEKRFDDLQFDPANTQYPGVTSQRFLPQPLMSQQIMSAELMPQQPQQYGIQYNTQYSKSSIPLEPISENNFPAPANSEQDIPLGPLVPSDGGSRVDGNVRLKDLLTFSKNVLKNVINFIPPSFYEFMHQQIIAL